MLHLEKGVNPSYEYYKELPNMCNKAEPMKNSHKKRQHVSSEYSNDEHNRTSHYRKKRPTNDEGEAVLAVTSTCKPRTVLVHTTTNGSPTNTTVTEVTY